MLLRLGCEVQVLGLTLVRIDVLDPQFIDGLAFDTLCSMLCERF